MFRRTFPSPPTPPLSLQRLLRGAAPKNPHFYKGFFSIDMSETLKYYYKEKETYIKEFL